MTRKEANEERFRDFRNSDSHVIEICAMALDLLNVAKMVIRPDTKQPITMKCGINTG